VSPDLSDLLHAAAPAPSRPLDVRRVVQRGRRRALAAPAAAVVGVLGAAAAAGLVLSSAPAEDRLDVARPPAAAPTPAAEAPLGSGACATTSPTTDGSGSALPADFVADVLVVCATEYRELPGDGGWEVLVERRSRDLAERAAALLRQPDPQAPPRSGQPGLVGCRLSLPSFPHVVLVDAGGREVQPRIPRDECGFPDPALADVTGPDAPLTEVGVTRLRQQRSQAEVASGCQGYKNMIAVEAESPSRPAVAGPVFPARPEQLSVCVYRQVPGDPTSSTFSRGRPLTAAETSALVDELGDAGPGPQRCDDPSLDYAVLSGHGGWVLVEIGGCDRVLRDDYTRGQLRSPSSLLAEVR
jgi:hypothetical protein